METQTKSFSGNCISFDEWGGEVRLLEIKNGCMEIEGVEVSNGKKRTGERTKRGKTEISKKSSQ